ncbi:hypothetical protein [Rhizobium leguminosarum]|uniref:hypothetical protein n=1 Tax=Rhizobium leguminosarum TaxID=384 RepID=UPI00103E0514|nr:hypothetical protein [Rhizobium leguminosarum]TBZ69037.1 hypothetical protein E0H61_32875 [Rhizobium leguminosarum bv. viciae]
MSLGLSKNDLLELNPDMRAFALVGAFMGYFALMEAGINAALGEVLEAKGARAAIITRNMTFDDKIKTLRTLVDFFILDKQKAAEFDELARRARKFGEMRNIVAHTAFRGSSKSNGVEFFTMEANSKLKFPETDWSIDDFLKHIDTINGIEAGLGSIESRMSLQRVARALMEKPKGSLGGLFGLGAEFMAEDDGVPTGIL